MAGISGVWTFKDLCYKPCKFAGTMDVCDGSDNSYPDGCNNFLLLPDFGCCQKKICNNCEAQRPARRRARHRGSSEPKDSYHGRLCRSVVYHLVATKSSYVLYPFDNE